MESMLNIKSPFAKKNQNVVVVARTVRRSPAQNSINACFRADN
jgi:hypothetical protein